MVMDGSRVYFVIRARIVSIRSLEMFFGISGSFRCFGVLFLVVLGYVHVLAASSNSRLSRLIGTRSALGKDSLVSDGGRSDSSSGVGAISLLVVLLSLLNPAI